MYLRLTLCQVSLSWEDPSRNREHLEALIKQHSGETDIYVLPETFTTGFTMSTRNLAEPPDGPSVEWMRRLAADKGSAIMGSLIIRESGSIFNRLVVMQPEGNAEVYDKRHLFRMSSENEHFQRGASRVIVRHRNWHICPMICYDLRFPVWSRNRNDYDVLVYIANWPEARRDVWLSLLKARAIENYCYVIGLNRVGTDGMGISYCGDSIAIDFKGQVMMHSDRDTEELSTVVLDHKALDGFRKKFPVYLDADEFEIKQGKE